VKKLGDKDRMPFGKYNGKTMEEVPAGYLLWLDTELEEQTLLNEAQQAVREYIDDNRSVLESESK
jgi:hypothetical protein